MLLRPPPCPDPERRGPEGLLGTGELPALHGVTGPDPSRTYPLDIANRNAPKSVRSSMRWVASIAERDFTFLHAKALITERGVLLGSMNWSENSVKNAFELGVFLQTEREIHEAYQLFEILWAAAGEEPPLTAAAIDAMMERRRNRRVGGMTSR